MCSTFIAESVLVADSRLPLLVTRLIREVETLHKGQDKIIEAVRSCANCSATISSGPPIGTPRTFEDFRKLEERLASPALYTALVNIPRTMQTNLYFKMIK